MRKRAARIKQRIQAHQRRRSVNKAAAAEPPQEDANTRHEALMAQLRSIFRACHNGSYNDHAPETAA